jgi:hypothetical protein
MVFGGTIKEVKRVLEMVKIGRSSKKLETTHENQAEPTPAQDEKDKTPVFPTEIFERIVLLCDTPTRIKLLRTSGELAYLASYKLFDTIRLPAIRGAAYSYLPGRSPVVKHTLNYPQYAAATQWLARSPKASSVRELDLQFPAFAIYNHPDKVKRNQHPATALIAKCNKNLRSLRLTVVGPRDHITELRNSSLPAIPFPELTHLSLQNMLVQDIFQALALLQNAPKIEYLRIDAYTPCATDQYVSLPSCPSLCELHLAHSGSGGSPGIYWRILNVTPNITTLSLGRTIASFQTEEGQPRDCWEVIKRLRSLRCLVWRMGTSEVVFDRVGRGGGFPAVENLVLGDRDFRKQSFNISVSGVCSLDRSGLMPRFRSFKYLRCQSSGRSSSALKRLSPIQDYLIQKLITNI